MVGFWKKKWVMHDSLPKPLREDIEIYWLGMHESKKKKKSYHVLKFPIFMKSKRSHACVKDKEKKNLEELGQILLV